MSQTVHFQGNPVSVQGTIPQAGATAQPFTLVAKDLSDVALSQFAGKRKVRFCQHLNVLSVWRYFATVARRSPNYARLPARKAHKRTTFRYDSRKKR